MTTVQDPRAAGTLPTAPTGDHGRLSPWTEPGAFTPGSRPRTQYWDVMNARWVSRSPVPVPRRGD